MGLAAWVVGLFMVAAVLGAGCGGAPVVEDEVVVAAEPLLGPGQVVVLPLLGAEHARSTVWGVPEVVGAIAELGPDVLLVDATAAELGLLQSARAAERGSDGTAALLVAPEPAVVALSERRPELLPLVADAALHGREVVAVGVLDDEARAARTRWIDSHPFGDGGRDYLAARAAYYSAWLGRDGPNDLNFLLSADYARLAEQYSRWLSYVAEERLGPMGELRGLAREAALAEDALAARPEARVVVLVSHERRYFVEQALRMRFADRLVPATSFLPRP